MSAFPRSVDGRDGISVTGCGIYEDFSTSFCWSVYLIETIIYHYKSMLFFYEKILKEENKPTVFLFLLRNHKVSGMLKRQKSFGVSKNHVLRRSQKATLSADNLFSLCTGNAATHRMICIQRQERLFSAFFVSQEACYGSICNISS